MDQHQRWGAQEERRLGQAGLKHIWDYHCYILHVPYGDVHLFECQLEQALLKERRKIVQKNAQVCVGTSKILPTRENGFRLHTIPTLQKIHILVYDGVWICIHVCLTDHSDINEWSNGDHHPQLHALPILGGQFVRSYQRACDNSDLLPSPGPYRLGSTLWAPGQTSLQLQLNLCGVPHPFHLYLLYASESFDFSC